MGDTAASHHARTTAAPVKEDARQRTERPTVLQPKQWREFLRYLGPHRWLLFAGGILTLFGSFAGLAQPVAARSVVDGMEDGSPIVGILVVLSACLLLAAVLNAVGYYLLMRVSENVVLHARQGLIRRLLRLRVAESSRFQPGDLMARTTSDTTLMRAAVSTALVETVNGALVLFAIIVMMAVMDWVLLLTTLGSLLFAAVAVGALMPWMKSAARRVQEGVAALSASMERSLGAFRTIKAAGAELQAAADAEDGAQRAWHHGLQVGRLEAVVSTVATLAVQIAFLAVLGVGGARVASGAIGLGTLIAFLLYLFYMLPPLGSMASAIAQFNVCAGALARISEVMGLRTEDVDHGSAGYRGNESLTRENASLSVELRNVVFAYSERREAIHHGVSFEVPARGMTALVGPSGAGKSTVFALVERFYEAQEGRVLVGGHDVCDWPLRSLRSAISYVEQDAPVLSGTLRENICIGAGPVADDEIWSVIRRVHLADLTERLPDGLDTELGHRGVLLSGGERQRIAIGRALLRAPRLLLLDEATSQLDARNESALRQVIEEVSEETTVLVVAHRLSTVVAADRIVVMDSGLVRAVGTHEELVASDSLYHDLAMTQMLTTDDPATPHGGAAFR